MTTQFVKFQKLLGVLLLTLGAGCASSNTPVTHVWKEIRGIGVPYEGRGVGEAVLVGDLYSKGCTWLPKGTVVFGDKPWPRSAYSPIYAYRLPGTTSIWPCTAEAVDHDKIYFSHAVIPTKRIRCNLVNVGGVSGDGKAVIRPD